MSFELLQYGFSDSLPLSKDVLCQLNVIDDIICDAMASCITIPLDYSIIPQAV